jgi:hypothetical protein
MRDGRVTITDSVLFSSTRFSPPQAVMTTARQMTLNKPMTLKCFDMLIAPE